MSTESPSRRAARWLDETRGLVQDAADRFGVTRQSVALAWRVLWPGRPLPSRDKGARDAKIIALAGDGKFSDEVAALVGVTRGTVERVLRARGVSFRSRHGANRQMMDRAAALALRGTGTVGDVAADLGIAAQRLQRHLSRSGVVLPRLPARDRARRDGRVLRAAERVLRGEATVLDACVKERCAAPAVYRRLRRLQEGG